MPGAVNVLPAAYRVHYNGFDFDGNATETLSIDSDPIYDEAGRTIIWMRYLISLRTTISGGNGATDLQLDDIRQILQSPGGTFIYDDRGFGNFSVNSNGPARDVQWGPKPRMLSWKPLGDANAAEVNWRVEVCIPECDAAKFEDHAAAYNYRVTYERDADGFTTRKVNGYILIPQTRDQQGNRKFRHSADEYREKVGLKTPFNFRPLPATYSLSMDKCRLDFSTGDEEMGSDIPPPGVIRVEANMDAQNTRPGPAMIQFAINLTATYTLAKGVPQRLAYEYFKRFAFSRRAQAIKDANAQSCITQYWHPGEPRIYNKAKQASFAISFLLTRELGDLMIDGFYRPVPDSDWNKWAVPPEGILPNPLFNPRGQAGLKFDPSDDVIIDLCQQDVKVRPPGRIKQVRDQRNGKIKAPLPDLPGWILWEQSIRFESEGEPYIHKPLDPQTNSLRTPGTPTSFESSLKTPNLIGKTPGLFAPPGSAKVDTTTGSVIGERAAPTYYLVYTGRAARAGQPIQCPTILGIGPLKVVPANRKGDGFVCVRVPGLSGNIHVATWRLRFLVPAKIGVDGAMPNPTFDESSGRSGWDFAVDEPGSITSRLRKF